MLFSLGITISGLPLMVGESATINCMINIPVDSIEWRDQSSQLNMSISVLVDLTVLEYTIPLVTDDLQGQQFTCIAIAGASTYTETVDIQVQGVLCTVL